MLIVNKRFIRHLTIINVTKLVYLISYMIMYDSIPPHHHLFNGNIIKYIDLLQR